MVTSFRKRKAIKSIHLYKRRLKKSKCKLRIIEQHQEESSSYEHDQQDCERDQQDYENEQQDYEHEQQDYERDLQDYENDYDQQKSSSMDDQQANTATIEGNTIIYLCF